MLIDGRYLIVREIGAGGIGTIYLAQDQKLHAAPVVIKVLQDRFQQSEHRIWLEKKFCGEIKALARINHHGVVHALDAGQLSDGRLYLVMEFVSGVPLREVIPPDGMDPERIGRLIHQITQALGAAHEQGVIHR
ncbi:MAG: serine/threonine protein kinase, partial [Blastocatellia bacterium]